MKDNSLYFQNPSNRIDTEIINILFPEIIQCILYYINVENIEIYDKISNISKLVQKMVIFCVKDVSELSQIIETLKKNYYKIKLKTKELAIEWLSLLFENYSEKVLNKNDKIVGAIIQNINFKEIILTENILKLLCQMA